VDQGGSVPLVHVAAFDWPSLPSSPPPASGRHSRDRRGTVTEGMALGATVQG